MKARFAASIALAAGIAIGASGCTFITPQATTEHYAASDGINADIGSVHVRNALLLTDDGESAALAMTVTNPTDADVDLAVQYEDATGERVTQTLLIPAGTSIVFGGADEPALPIADLGVAAGDFSALYFQYGTAEGGEHLVPVLDGALPEYAAVLEAVPEQTPEPTADAD
ncbi:DNA modification methylase [Agromyces archimandritae]|uniref:DNA modification methylase n=1 Tax=Agromyces archimandritae TaxID=2781962 RepID=A0A975IPG4_9MICO|nr:DNA modification methylase [Agromyces archimandritae]QTX03981.1 DNA modification methylase [Agromyces archimandritae]